MRPAAGSGATVPCSSRALRVGVLVLKKPAGTPALGNTPTQATAHRRVLRETEPSLVMDITCNRARLITKYVLTYFFLPHAKEPSPQGSGFPDASESP